jgi:polar amino acid transport system substrate-binding protein
MRKGRRAQVFQPQGDGPRPLHNAGGTRRPAPGRRGGGARPGLTLACVLVACLWATASAAQPAEDAEAPALRLGVAASGAPLASFDQGVLRGLVIDLGRALARDLDMELQVREMPEARLVDALRGGRIDLMLSTLPPTDLDALGLAASGSLFQTGQMALILAEDLAGFSRTVDIITTDARVGYQQGTAGARFVQNSMPAAERVPFADVEDGILALRRGDVDLFIHEAPTVWAVATDGAEEQLLGIFQPLTDERAAWILRAEDKPLLMGVNLVLRGWRESGRLSRIVNRWIPIRVEVAR